MSLAGMKENVKDSLNMEARQRKRNCRGEDEATRTDKEEDET